MCYSLIEESIGTGQQVIISLNSRTSVPEPVLSFLYLNMEIEKQTSRFSAVGQMDVLPVVRQMFWHDGDRNAAKNILAGEY